MPELPEVETTVRALREPLIGRRITAVSNDWPRQIASHEDVAAFDWQIRGQQIDAINRRAKYLVFSLSGDDTLIIHLKMSGHLAVEDAAAPRHKHVHTVFSLDNGRELRFRDMRKFGRVYLVQEPETVLGGLGPEPLDEAFSPDVLRERLNGRSRAMKPLLLDQSFIAGVGNIYADEALFYSSIHPRRTADSLTQNEIVALYAAIQKVLTMGIEREGASIDLYTKPDGTRGDMQNAVAVFRRTGMPCYQCQTPINRIVMNSRSTHFCPQCQPYPVKSESQ
ncbi:MAG: bifunctional DNA-formamidopyrimidine glycosylase/DNA-(apurinic or apyrimidinic site) lyase [Anaerolineae bacterium]|nr:bifunctional DNA-formamidopyrimidine glycosylase/DNA-(apurinic or apyrimidinic site) lyase [Anaerolineae bacterium]